jgi:transcription elongation factor GreB
MNTPLIKNNADDDEEEEQNNSLAVGLPANFKNYIRPSGLQKLKDELLFLLDTDRPAVVKIVSWAASNGDRSENGDYLYGKKRLREIDRRIRFLTKRIDSSVVVDPANREGVEQIFFGASVRFSEPDGTLRDVTIVGVDETETASGLISWISPVATALIKARAGDQVFVRTPQGNLKLEIVEISYHNNQ